MPLSLEFGVNTFRWHVEFSTFDDRDRLRWLVSSALGDILNLFDNIIALQDLAKNDMAPIEPADRSILV